jgi:hypothetical protein
MSHQPDVLLSILVVLAIGLVGFIAYWLVHSLLDHYRHVSERDNPRYRDIGDD